MGLREPTLDLTSLKEKILGIYFDAHWCHPCRQFTPILAAKYSDIIKAGQAFEIVFVSSGSELWSSDRSQGEADSCFKEMPWKALPFSEQVKKYALKAKFKVQGIPTLLLLDEHGNVRTLDGRPAVVTKQFPFE